MENVALEYACLQQIKEVSACARRLLVQDFAGSCQKPPRSATKTPFVVEAPAASGVPRISEAKAIRVNRR